MNIAPQTTKTVNGVIYTRNYVITAVIGGGVCECCGKSDLQKTFIVEHVNTREAKALGSSCVRKYTGWSAQEIAAAKTEIKDGADFAEKIEDMILFFNKMLEKSNNNTYYAEGFTYKKRAIAIEIAELVLSYKNRVNIDMVYLTNKLPRLQSWINQVNIQREQFERMKKTQRRF